MPLRTIQQSHRPRVSDRIMSCHSFIEWITTVRLVRFRNEWRRHKRIWDHKGEKAVALVPRKATLESRVHVQTVGLNAKKIISALSRGEIFFLTFPFIGPLRAGGLRFIFATGLR